MERELDHKNQELKAKVNDYMYVCQDFGSCRLFFLHRAKRGNLPPFMAVFPPFKLPRLHVI